MHWLYVNPYHFWLVTILQCDRVNLKGLTEKMVGLLQYCLPTSEFQFGLGYLHGGYGYSYCCGCIYGGGSQHGISDQATGTSRAVQLIPVHPLQVSYTKFYGDENDPRARRIALHAPSCSGRTQGTQINQRHLVALIGKKKTQSIQAIHRQQSLKHGVGTFYQMLKYWSLGDSTQLTCGTIS